jgi:[lysine-biosynthesis-protein LysW]--L-2-aminoadipate ligase
MNIAMLYSLIRKDEKMMMNAAERRGIKLDLVDDRQLVFGLTDPTWKADVVIERCISHSRALYALKFLEDYGVTTVNRFAVAQLSGDKALSSLALERAKVPTPKTFVAFEPESAIKAIERVGYPAVMKPITGSWGRLLAKVDSRHAAEAIIEHKQTLGSYPHHIYYIQEYIDKPQRDKGALVRECPVDEELRELSLRAAEAVGGGVLAIDIMESDRGLLVLETNYTMEFKNSVAPTGVDIPGAILEYSAEVARR